MIRLGVKAGIASLFVLTAFTVTTSGSLAEKQYLSQNVPQKLTVIDIEKQVEIRLNKVWAGLPSLPTGATTLDFTLKSDGSLASLFPVKSSGNPTFDKAAMGTVKRVIPLPNLPEHLNIKSMKLRAHFSAGQSRKVKLGFAPLSFGPPPKTRTVPTQQRPPLQAQQHPPIQAQQRPPLQAQQRPPLQAQQRPPLQAQQRPPLQSQQRPPLQAQQRPPLQAQQKRIMPPQQAPAQRAQTIYRLVNGGVVSINAGDYNTAIKKLEEALRIEPNHQVAKQNLAIAYNNYGLKLQSKPQEAIKIYHKAILLDPKNAKTKSNLEALIVMLGKNPKSFADRKALGDMAFKNGDKIGAKVEYIAALRLKNDPGVRQRLAQLEGRQVPPKAEPTQKVQQQKPKVQQVPRRKPKPKAKPKTLKPVSAKVKSAPGKKPVVRNKLDQVYSRLASLEKKLFGKTFSGDDIIARLTRLEKKSFGKVQNGSAKRRLDALLLAN